MTDPRAYYPEDRSQRWRKDGNDVSGWGWVLIIVAVIVVLLAVAWVTSGRSRPRGEHSPGMTDVEKDDAMRQNQRRQQGAGGGFI